MLENIFQVKASRILKSCIFFFLLLSFLMILNLNLTIYFKFIWLFATILFAFPLIRQVINYGNVSLQVLNETNWLISDETGKAEPALLLRDSIVTPFFLVLRFQCQQHVKSYLITLDSLEKKAFKSLLLRLKVTVFEKGLPESKID